MPSAKCQDVELVFALGTKSVTVFDDASCRDQRLGRLPDVRRAYPSDTEIDRKDLTFIRILCLCVSISTFGSRIETCVYCTVFEPHLLHTSC